MTVRRTEQVYDRAEGLDLQPSHAILQILSASQAEAAMSVKAAIPAIAAAAEADG